MNTTEFCKINKVTMTAEYASINPNMVNEKWQANHYKVTLRYQGRQYTTYFSQGLGIAGSPEVDSVLDCLASDAQGVDGATFENWASDYGYDTDSCKAEKIFKACQREAVNLRRLLGAKYTDLLNCDQL